MAEQVSLQEAFDETWGKKGKQPKAWESAFTEWQGDQTPDRLRSTVQSLQPVIDQAVNSYVGKYASPTVKQRAKIIAARAIQSYDPNRGAGLNTHVYNQLRELQRSAPAIQDPLAPPERFRRQQMEITDAQNLLMEEMGRDPTDEEVAEITGIPQERVTRVRSRMRARVPMSIYEGSSEDEAPDIVGSEWTPYDEWVDAVYHDLGEIDRLILMHRTGYRNAQVMTNQDIAQLLNVSPAAVSQRASRIQRKLDQFHASPR